MPSVTIIYPAVSGDAAEISSTDRFMRTTTYDSNSDGLIDIAAGGTGVASAADAEEYVRAAGALMDDELADIAGVKAYTQTALNAKQAKTGFTMEALTITVTNTFPNVTNTPTYQTGTSAGLFIIVVNGTAFLPVGASPPFSVSGKAITWLSASFNVTSYDSVAVLYN